MIKCLVVFETLEKLTYNAMWITSVRHNPFGGKVMYYHKVYDPAFTESRVTNKG